MDTKSRKLVIFEGATVPANADSEIVLYNNNETLRKRRWELSEQYGSSKRRSTAGTALPLLPAPPAVNTANPTFIPAIEPTLMEQPAH